MLGLDYTIQAKWPLCCPPYQPAHAQPTSTAMHLHSIQPITSKVALLASLLQGSACLCPVGLKGERKRRLSLQEPYCQSVYFLPLAYPRYPIAFFEAHRIRLCSGMNSEGARVQHELKIFDKRISTTTQELAWATHSIIAMNVSLHASPESSPFSMQRSRQASNGKKNSRHEPAFIRAPRGRKKR